MERIEFLPERDAEVFAAAPAAPAVFLLRGSDPASEPYVTKTANLRRRLERMLSPPEERSRRLNLRDRVRYIEYSLTGSDFESGFLLYQLLRTAFPKTYEKRLRLRFAPLVKLHLENEYPRASVTTRLGRLGGKNIYYGPFPSRIAAEKFMNDALDFFKMRRCVDDLHPDPKFPGCVYSEMKMCLAPCFKGCTDDEYRAEVVRVEDFFDTRGESLKRQISAERDRSSESLAFEEAAALHTRLEKLAPVLQQMPEAVQRLDQMHALIVQQSAASGERHPLSDGSRGDCRAADFPHLRKRTYQNAIDGSPHPIGAGRVSLRATFERDGTHGASGDSEALVLSRKPQGRNFLC